MAARSRSRRRKKKSVIQSSDYIYDFSCYPCSNKGKITEGLFKCVDCVQYFCDKCLDFHKQTVKDHTIISASDTYTKQDESCILGASDDGDTNYLHNRKEVKEFHSCEYHKGEPITLYCFSHGEVGCKNCIYDDHGFCGDFGVVESIQNIVKQHAQEDDDVTHDLQKIASDLRDLKYKQSAFYKEVEQKREEKTAEIQRFKAQLVKEAEDKERMSLQEVERRSNSITTSLDYDMASVNKMLSDVEKDINHIQQHSSDDKVGMFVKLKLAKRRLSKNGKCCTELIGKPLEKIDFNIHPPMKNYFKDYESFGTLTISKETLAPFVNIMIPVETAVANELKNRLESDLQNVGILSKFIETSELVADVHTIVVISCLNDIRYLQVDRQYHRYIILLRLDDTSLLDRSWIDKLSDYMKVPIGEEVINFLNWADVALKTSISFTCNYRGFHFNISDIRSTMTKIAGIVDSKTHRDNAI